MICYCYARHSLLELLNNDRHTKVWLADITCIEVVETLVGQGFNISYYLTDRGLPLISKDFGVNINSKDVLVLTHHYGFKYDIHSFPEGLRIIHDFTQSMLSYSQIRSFNGIYFTSVRKYIGTKYGSLSSLDSLPTNKNNSIRLNILSLLKMIALELDPVKYYYNYYQSRDSSSGLSEVKSLKISDFCLRHILYYKIKSIRFKKSLVLKFLQTRKIEIFNNNKNSYFGVIENDHNNRKLREFGFNVYQWPDIGEMSHVNALAHRQRYLFINYDIPWSLLLLIYYQIERQKS